MKLPVSHVSRFLPLILVVLALPVTVFVMQQQQNLRQQAAGTTCTFTANKNTNGTSISSTVTITNQGGYDRVEWNADKHNTQSGQFVSNDKRYSTLATNFASITFSNLQAGNTYKMYAEIYPDAANLPAILCTPEKWIEITGSTTTNPTATKTPVPNQPTATKTPVPTQPTGGGTTYNITGYVWKDNDGDGQIETSAFGGTETYFSGVNVYVQQNGSTVKQASSNSVGEFTLSGLSAGTYSVYVTEPSGWTRTTGEPVSVTVGPSKGTKFGLKQSSTGGTNPTATAVPTQPGGTQVYSIQGSVFKDTNGDGQKNNGEVNFPNVRVDALNGNGFFVKSATTNNLGSYFMEVNAPGQYVMQIVGAGIPAGWTLSTQNSVSVTLSTTNKLANVPPFGLKQTSSAAVSPTSAPGTNCTATSNRGLSCACEETSQCGSGATCIEPVAGFGKQCMATTSGNSTQLALSLSVGDSAAQDSISVQEVTVQLLDTSGAVVKEVSGTLALDGQTGEYTGTVNAGTITTGNYTIKAKLTNSLRAVIGGGNRTLYANTLNTLPLTNLVMGDANNDNQITLADFSILFDCYKDVASCQEAQESAADFYVDNTIDILDYNIFLNSIQNNPTGE